MGRNCQEHEERNANGLCIPCRREISRRHVAKKRAERAQSWPCKQCWRPIPRTSRGGNRKWICDECAPDLRFRMLVMRYGVDRAMYDAMYFDQAGQCAISGCEREAKSVDHCHTTGKVRGLLCQGCNAAIGILESPGWMTGAHEYLGRDGAQQ